MRRLVATPLKSRRAEPKQLSGNLEFFDLATVIQTLIGSHQTGSLIVSSLKHERVSEIVFFKGNIVRAQFQQLKGDDAVFQLFQSKPEGEFAFTSREVEEQQRIDITLPGIFAPDGIDPDVRRTPASAGAAHRSQEGLTKRSPPS